MRKVLAAFAALVLLFLVPLHAADWSLIATKLAKSVVEIESADGRCTGFVINDNVKGDKDYVLTAGHCDGEKLFAKGAAAKVISKDSKKDLLVVEVDNLDRPALKLAKENPKPGEEVISFGYGYGLDRPMLRVTHIADDATYIPYEGIGGPFFVTDATFVPGQSGGPVINAAGEVVMIVQLGTESVGFGVGAEVIKDKVGRYFGKDKP